MQFGAIVAAPQHGNDQPVTLGQGLAFGNIDQFHQQAMIDEGHQHGLGHFAQVAAEGAEQLAFRQHGSKSALAGRNLF
ncbi:hypothetical protein D3C77_680020 [compost metagenome]